MGENRVRPDAQGGVDVTLLDRYRYAAAAAAGLASRAGRALGKPARGSGLPPRHATASTFTCLRASLPEWPSPVLYRPVLYRLAVWRARTCVTPARSSPSSTFSSVHFQNLLFFSSFFLFSDGLCLCFPRCSVRSLMSLDLPHVALKTITKPADVMIFELIALNSEYQYEFEWVAIQVCLSLARALAFPPPSPSFLPVHQLDCTPAAPFATSPPLPHAHDKLSPRISRDRRLWLDGRRASARFGHVTQPPALAAQCWRGGKFASSALPANRFDGVMVTPVRHHSLQ